MTRPNSEILQDCLTVATQVTQSPASAFGHRERLETLRREVVAAIRRPQPDGHVIDETAGFLMMAAIKIAGAEWKEPRWLQLAAFLLPFIRDDWRRALEIEMGLKS